MDRLNGLINKALTQRGLEKGKLIEMKCEELINTGCECGNKNINNFTLCYFDNEFGYILCEKCKTKHYVGDSI